MYYYLPGTINFHLFLLLVVTVFLVECYLGSGQNVICTHLTGPLEGAYFPSGIIHRQCHREYGFPSCEHIIGSYGHRSPDVAFTHLYDNDTNGHGDGERATRFFLRFKPFMSLVLWHVLRLLF